MRRAFLSVLPDGPFVEIGARVEIGRARTCELLLSSARVSRHHAEVTRSGDVFVARDLGNSGGTYLQRPDGKLEKIRVRSLEDGDRLHFIDFIVVFTFDEPLVPRLDP